MSNNFTSVEICAGAGGQALGLERAGFDHAVLVEWEQKACDTLLLNRPGWNVISGDVHDFDGNPYKGVDLLAGGVPCPPFSVAGKRLGDADERDLFPEVLRLAKEIQPDAIMIENVKGLLAKPFETYRRQIIDELGKLGYWAEWRLFNASHFGVPQARMRSVLVGLRPEIAPYFQWPEGDPSKIVTVGQALEHLMGSNAWPGAKAWAKGANSIAPTLSGGSTKHGGADLGPTRTKQAWKRQGVDAYGIADNAPDANFTGDPKLTVPMAAVLQGFPEDWRISGRKTKAYRQVGNAFPPPVAEAVGVAIAKALANAKKAAKKAAKATP